MSTSAGNSRWTEEEEGEERNVRQRLAFECDVCKRRPEDGANGELCSRVLFPQKFLEWVFPVLSCHLNGLIFLIRWRVLLGWRSTWTLLGIPEAMNCVQFVWHQLGVGWQEKESRHCVSHLCCLFKQTSNTPWPERHGEWIQNVGIVSNPTRSFNHEDTEWAKTKKSNGAPTGNRCMRCFKAITAAWPLKDWDTIMNERVSSTAMHKEVEEVILRWDGQVEKNFRKEEFVKRSWTGHVVEAKYKLYTEKQFTSEFKAEPKSLGLVAETLTDHLGEAVTGFLVKEDSPLEVRAYHAVVGELAMLLQQAQHQLRANQGSDFAKSWFEDLHKVQPKAFSKASDALTASSIEGLKVKAAAEAEQKQAEAHQATPIN
eukprot:6492652-Amphidinium_carterae.1